MRPRDERAMTDAQKKVVIRRPNPGRFAAEADTVSALFIEARRAALPNLKVLRSVDETHEWMRDVVFPRCVPGDRPCGHPASRST